MSTWLERLKNKNVPNPNTTKPTKPATDTHAERFVGFVAHPPAPSEKSAEEFCRFRSLPVGEYQNSDGAVAHSPPPLRNEPTTDPDHCAWPHSGTPNGEKFDTHMSRQALFQQRGISTQDAERLADKLVARDRDGDDRRLCLECRHLRGDGPYRCGNARAAGLQPDLPREWVSVLQRCHGFNQCMTSTSALPVGEGFQMISENF